MSTPKITIKRMTVFSSMARAVAVCALALVVGIAYAAEPLDFTSWEFFSGKTSRGTGLCSLNVAAKTSPQRNVGIKALANRDGLNVTLYNADWNFRAGESVPFMLDFADQQPLTITGYGDGQVVDVELPKDVTASFLSLLAERSKLQLQVGDQRQRLSVPLVGIKPKLKSFVDCALVQGNTSSLSAKKAKVGVDDACKSIRFTGLAATRFPSELDEAKKAVDLEDYLARNPIRCKPNNSCSGIGFFENSRARVLNGDEKYLHVMAPVNLTTGRQDIYLAILRADARCTSE